MENGQKRISELFDGRKIFNIPKYQRAYAWEKKQLKDFVEDIENQKPDRSYFFGTILFQEQQRHEGFEMIDIVDGQQRITTLIIFMKLLLAEWKKAGNDVTMLKDTYIQIYNRYKLHVLETDNDFFTSYILQDNRPDDSQVHTPSQRRLLKAKDFLSQSLEASSDKIKEFIDTIESMKVLTYSVEDKAEATLIFETTNDRGKSLTNLEKTKSFLMHKTYIVSDNPETELDIHQNRFSEIYRAYEEIESRVDEDSILQYHFIAFFEEWKNKSEYQNHVQTIKQKVNGLINANSTVEAAEFINQYSLELKESFEFTRTLFISREPYLLDIFALSRQATFYPLLIKTYKSDNSDGKDNFKRVAQLVEIICFRLSIIGSRADKGREFLYGLAKGFNGDFQQLIRKLRHFISSNCSDLAFERALKSPSFHSDVNLNDQRYLFWKYENYLRGIDGYSEMSYDEFTNNKPRSRFSIEHIIPQNPKESKVVVEDSILATTDFESSEFKENYLHSIGNLTIDPISANASKSNQNFPYKNQRYFCRAPLMAQNELIDFLNDETGQWDTASISNRARTIRLFALERWNPRKLGRKSSEIAERIPHRIAKEEIWEDIFRPEEPVQE
ncbi:MAG: DUF262 domain-containing HNH endonuclease family protein [Candidatus Poribacteria bacterium]|nr:DUF262 domain-containing HNH endonuclease family protein [Candidatus Poribacteria bacterium]